MRNLHTAVTAKHAPAVTAAVKTIFAPTDPVGVPARWDRVADTLAGSFPTVAAMMSEAKTDVLAFTTFPPAHWQKIWSNNPIERLNKEITRRADVVEIFPDPAAFLRLATAVVIEAHDEWHVTRRYLSDISMEDDTSYCGLPSCAFRTCLTSFHPGLSHFALHFLAAASAASSPAPARDARW